MEGSPAPKIPASWIQGRSLATTLDGLEARVSALAGGGGPEPEPGEALMYAINKKVNIGETRLVTRARATQRKEIEKIVEGSIVFFPYPRTAFSQVLDETPDTAQNWSTRSIVQVRFGSGPQGQVRVVFEAAPNKDFRINNASIGVSIMANVHDVPDNGATQGIPKELFPLGGYKRDSAGQHWYVMRGSKTVTEWTDFPAFTKDNLLVVVIDHNSDTGNPTGKSNLGAFPAPGATRQAYQAGTKSYNSNQGLSSATDGLLWAVTQIEVR